jgi:hypothetical protein
MTPSRGPRTSRQRACRPKAARTSRRWSWTWSPKTQVSAAWTYSADVLHTKTRNRPACDALSHTTRMQHTYKKPSFFQPHAGLELHAAHGHRLPGRQILAITLGRATTSTKVQPHHPQGSLVGTAPREDEGAALDGAPSMQFVEVFVLQQSMHSNEYYVVTDTLCMFGMHDKDKVVIASLRVSLAQAHAHVERLQDELDEARKAAFQVEEKAESAEKKLRKDYEERQKVRLVHIHTYVHTYM